MKATISTTKFFALEFEGVCCDVPVYYKGVNNLYNKKAILYPKYTCPISGRTVAMAYCTTFEKTPTYNWNGRAKYIKYFNDTYNGGKDPWNWDNYEIHHIRPKGFGGDSAYSNLFPLPKYPFNIHNDFTQWWRNYQ